MSQLLHTVRLVSTGACLAGLLLIPACGKDSFWGREDGESAGPYSHDLTMEVVADQYRFTPAEITVQAGQRMHVTLTNRGPRSHSLAFNLPTGQARLDQPIPPGQSRTLEVVAPEQAGTYAFYSPAGNDRDMGLEGKLIVTARPGWSPPIHAGPSPMPPPWSSHGPPPRP